MDADKEKGGGMRQMKRLRNPHSSKNTQNSEKRQRDRTAPRLPNCHSLGLAAELSLIPSDSGNDCHQK